MKFGLNPEVVKQRWFQQLLLLIVILVTAWTRFWRLPQVPPGLWWDEAYNAMDAIWMLDSFAPKLFFVGNNGREPLHHYLSAMFMGVMGATPFTFRLVAAFVGVITIPLMYRCMMAFWKGNPDRFWLALLAATGLACSLWHLTMSRSGYRAILVAPTFALTLYFFWVGWQKNLF